MTPDSSNVQSSTSQIGAWLLAARPKTLWAAAAPVLVGTALAYEAGAAHAPSAFFALLGALLIQVGTNFSNDYLDFVQGADADTRKGPTRVTQAGLISVRDVRRATIFTFALAFLSGLYLIYRGGWPVLAIGVVSIMAGMLYTAGRYSLAYLGLGDVAVLLFFGPVAVGGTYYVQALTAAPPALPLVLLAGLAPGLLATAILLVNNVRDVEEDCAASKKTVVVRFGRGVGVALYAACFAGAALVPVALFLLTGRHPWVLAASLILLLAVPLIRQLRARREPDVLNPLLARTAQVLLAYSIVFSVGWNV